MINIDNIKVQIQTNNRNVYQWIDDVFIYISVPLKWDELNN